MKNQSRLNNIVFTLAVITTLLYSTLLQNQESHWLEWMEEAQQLQKSGNLTGAAALLTKALPEAEFAGRADVVLNNLASVLHDLGRNTDAERYYLRSLALLSGASRAHELARVVNNLAALYVETNRCNAAAALFQSYPADGPPGMPRDGLDYGNWLNNRGSVLQCLGHYKEAEPLHLRALAAYERSVGPNHFATRAAQANLAGVYQRVGEYGKALSLLRASLEAAERNQGQPAEIVGVRFAIAEVSVAVGKINDAQQEIRKSFSLIGASSGPESWEMLEAQTRYARLLRDWHRAAEARKVDRQVKAIRKRLEAESLRGASVGWSEFRGSPH